MPLAVPPNHLKSAYASGHVPKSSEECLRLWPGIPSSKGCQKFSRGSGLKTKVLDNVKSTHTSGCVRSSEEYLYLKSAYASLAVSGHLKSARIEKMTFDTITEFWKSGIKRSPYIHREGGMVCGVRPRYLSAWLHPRCLSRWLRPR